MENDKKKEEWVQPEAYRRVFDPIMFLVFLMSFFAHYHRHDFNTLKGVLDMMLLYLFGSVLYYTLRKDVVGYNAADHFLSIAIILNVILMLFSWIVGK